MDDWFTIEQIDADTYAISEYKHWEETHCYLLVGSERSLLIDTGLGVGNIKEIVLSLVSEEPLAVTTHIHWDHIGGHKYFKETAVFELEKDWLSKQFPIPVESVKSSLLKQPCLFPQDFDINKYQIYQGEPSHILNNNQIIDLGNRFIQVIHTPGHSPGHICLYEKEREYLFSGDVVYSGVLDAFYPTTNPTQFMQSIKEISKISIRKILPGHHTLNIDPTLINEIDQGFSYLQKNRLLVQGNGLYKFKDFSIHI